MRYEPTSPTVALALERASALSARRVLIFVTTLSVGLSGLSWTRVDAGGFSFHPFLLPLVALAVVCGAERFAGIPSRIRAPVLVFGGVFLAVCLLGGGNLPDAVKVVIALAQILVLAAAVDDERDLLAGTLGLAIAVGLLSLNALAGATITQAGVNPLAGVGNKNAFSIYALPSLLLSGWTVLRAGTSLRIRLVLGASIVASVVAIGASGNRSGLVGVAVIGFMLALQGRRLVNLLVVVVMGGVATYLMVTTGATEVVETRLDRSSTIEQSDDNRLQLFDDSLAIFVENPVLGVGPEQLRIELGERLEREGPTDPHNVVAYVMGSGGAVLTITFAAFLWGLVRTPHEWHRKAVDRADRSVLTLARMMVVLFLVRGLFSAEVLFLPGFMMAFGLIAGRLAALDEVVAAAPEHRWKLPNLFDEERARRAERSTPP